MVLCSSDVVSNHPVSQFMLFAKYGLQYGLKVAFIGLRIVHLPIEGLISCLFSKIIKKQI